MFCVTDNSQKSRHAPVPASEVNKLFLAPVFRLFKYFFLLVESNGNVCKLRSAAAQFAHFLLCEKIE